MREIKALCWSWLLFSFLLIIGMVGAVENGDHANWFQIATIVMSWVPCYRVTQKKNRSACDTAIQQKEKKIFNNSIIAGSERKCNDQRLLAIIAQIGL